MKTLKTHAELAEFNEGLAQSMATLYGAFFINAADMVFMAHFGDHIFVCENLDDVAYINATHDVDPDTAGLSQCVEYALFFYATNNAGGPLYIVPLELLDLPLAASLQVYGAPEGTLVCFFCDEDGDCQFLDAPFAEHHSSPAVRLLWSRLQ